MNKKPNSILVDIVGPDEQIQKAMSLLTEDAGGKAKDTPTGRTREWNSTRCRYHPGTGMRSVQPRGIDLITEDAFEVMPLETGHWENRNWCWASRREGKEIDLPAFTPRTVEFIPRNFTKRPGMLLLILVLLAYFPTSARRSVDGSCCIRYAIHRFINESLRIEPTLGIKYIVPMGKQARIFVVTAIILPQHDAF